MAVMKPGPLPDLRDMPACPRKTVDDHTMKQQRTASRHRRTVSGSSCNTVSISGEGDDAGVVVPVDDIVVEVGGVSFWGSFLIRLFKLRVLAMKLAAHLLF